MRTIVFLQGIPGSGKSTFIKTHNLENYTISTDNLRLLFSAPEMMEEEMAISQNNDKKVFKLLSEALETRMENGSFTVVDATHCSSKSLSKYKQMVTKYSYRAYVVKFDISLEEAIERNNHRGFRNVPVDVITRMYNNLSNFEYNKWYKVITPEEFDDEIKQRYVNLDEYDEIVHIGDIHGCFNALKKLEYSPKNYYIFMGDYFDRGLENAETAKFLMEWLDYPNVIFLYGNHERHITRYLSNGSFGTKEFARSIKEIMDSGITENQLKAFHKKLQFVFCYEFNGKKVICTHAGLPFEPEEIRFLNNKDFYNGIGGYQFDVDNAFIPATENLIQVHGHRNSFDLPYNAGPYSYNLNTSIEGGEPLRVMFFSKDGITCQEYPNENPNIAYHAESGVFKKLCEDKDIVKKYFGDIVSFNFSRETFWEKRWNKNTILARGLFCDVNTHKVLARGYEKFFEIGENKITSIENIKNLKYPLYAYQKENGYLGILGVHDGKLMFASKSSVESDFAGWFEAIFRKKIKNPDAVLKYLEENNRCMVFEVIDVFNDRHIIKYEKSDIILLDIIDRDYVFKRLPYTELCKVAKQFGMKEKSTVGAINTYEELERFLSKVQNYDYSHFGKKIEGFVIEDSSENVFHFKVKTGYYKFWKIVRNGIERNGLSDTEKLFKNLEYYNLTDKKDLMANVIEKYNCDKSQTLFDLQKNI